MLTEFVVLCLTIAMLNCFFRLLLIQIQSVSLFYLTPSTFTNCNTPLSTKSFYTLALILTVIFEIRKSVCLITDLVTKLGVISFIYTCSDD